MTDYVNRMGISSTDPARSSSLADVVKDWLENYSAETTPEGVTVIYASESGGDPVAYVYPADENGIVRVSVNGVDYYVSEDEIYPPAKPVRREEIEVAGEAEEVSEEEEVLESRPPEGQVCVNSNPDAFTPDTDPHHDYARQMSVPDEELNSTQNSAKRFVEYLCWQDETLKESGCVPVESQEDEVAKESRYKILEGGIPVNTDSDNSKIYYVHARRYEEEVTTENSAIVVEERPPDVQPNVQPEQAGAVAAGSEPAVDPQDIIPSEIGGGYGTEFDGAETRTVTENVVGSESAPAPMPAYTTDEIALAPMSAYPDETVTTLSAMSLDPSMAVDQASFAATEPSIASAVICYQQSLAFVGSGDTSTKPSLTQVAGTAAKVAGESVDGKLSLDRAGQSRADNNRAIAAADGLKSSDVKSSDGAKIHKKSHDRALRQAQDSVRSETDHDRAASKVASGEKIIPDANYSDPGKTTAAALQGSPAVSVVFGKGSTPDGMQKEDKKVTSTSPDEQSDGRGGRDKDGDSEKKRDEQLFLDLEDPEDLENEELMYS